MCQNTGVDLQDHYVVEDPDEKGQPHVIGLCSDCHDKHEKYRNYLRDMCNIKIDRTKSSQE